MRENRKLGYRWTRGNVIEEMRKDVAPAAKVDDYVQRFVYWSVFTRRPTAAKLGSAQVKTVVLEKKLYYRMCIIWMKQNKKQWERLLNLSLGE